METSGKVFPWQFSFLLLHLHKPSPWLCSWSYPKPLEVRMAFLARDPTASMVHFQEHPCVSLDAKLGRKQLLPES